MNRILPMTWCLDDIEKLPFKEDYHKDQLLIKKYIDSGHDSDRMTIYNYWEPNPMPDGVDDIRDHFSHLDHITLAIHLTPPGFYIPLHHDFYARYKDVNRINNDSVIERSIVMLDKNHPGQVFQIYDRAYATWSAGEVFTWYDDTPHAFYNFSMVDRYAVQITGVLR